MFELLAKNGPIAGKRFDLSSGKFVMGRHPECQIHIDVGAVSRQHCAIAVEKDGCYLEDLKSRNGTFVNDKVIEGRYKLGDTDVIRVCEVEFIFHSPNVETTRTAALPFTTATSSAPAVKAEMIDDEGQNSTVMTRLDAASGIRGTAAWHTSPEVKLAALVEIMTSLGRTLELDDVLSKILSSLFKIFLQADRGFIVLEEPGGRLIPRWTKARREEAADSIRISRTICRQVMETKQAILSADAASDQRFEMSQSIADFRIRSMMCAPLVDSDGKSLGVIQIDTLDQRKRFQGEDLELFVSVAGQASVAIQNAQLHEQALRQRESQRDMELAREVQNGFLPDQKPDVPNFEFFDYYQPAEQVGGDYFDYMTMPDGRVAIIVADVVGHGVAAALLMAKLSAEARYSLLSEAQPALAVTRLNERLCHLGVQRFVTMVLVVIDPKSSTAVVVSAGHMAPIIRRTDGSISEPGEDVSGLPLGITDDFGYEQAEFSLAPGEMVTLYTDGINECADAQGAMYGIDRLRDHCRKLNQSAAQLGPTIVTDVRTFLGKAVQNDDMCLVCFGRTG